MDDTIIFQNNLTSLFLCDNIILSKRKLAGTNIRQDGYFTACIAAYLSFWKNGLPYSIDVNGNPLTSISKDCCRCYNIETGKIEPAKLYFPIKTIVDKFSEYRKTFNRTHNDPTLLQVVEKLQTELESGAIAQDIAAWDIFVDKCRIAALKTKVSFLESENQMLKLKAASNNEEAINRLASYIDIIKGSESTYNANFDHHINIINEYKDEIRRIKFERLHNPTVDFDWTRDKALKDAIRYHRYYLNNLFAFYFRTLPVELKSIPIETVNNICNSSLKIYSRHEERRF